MMPRNGNLGQVVMNEHSALLLLSLLLVLMFLLFCCNYALNVPLELRFDRIPLPSLTRSVFPEILKWRGSGYLVFHTD